MNIEGRLSIQLNRHRTQVGSKQQPRLSCTIHSTRPLHISQLFAGKPIDYLLKTIPLLFNICGVAQATAALRATEQASGQTVTAETERCRDALVWLESLREQSWQLLLSSSQAMHEETDQTLLADLNRHVQLLTQAIKSADSDSGGATTLPVRAGDPDWREFNAIWQPLKTLVEDKLLAGAYCSRTQHLLNTAVRAQQQDVIPARFLHWLNQQPWADSGATSMAILPPAGAESEAILRQRLHHQGTSFTTAPDWAGQPREVSNFSLHLQHPLLSQLSRQRGNGIYTRSVARLLSIAQLIAQLQAFFTGTAPPDTRDTARKQPPNGRGLAQINAARGKLVHYVVLAADRTTVERYNILAPTEWNFHPRGVAAQGLENLDMRYPDTLEQQARLLIDAIDPCVGYDLTLNSGADTDA
jgi:hypothetical protein